MSESSRVPMPEPDPSSAPSDLSPSEASDREVDLSSLPSAHQDVVRRLRAKVQRAATLLNRLQEENERLRERVEELEGRPAVSGDKAVLALEEDPETLRDRISDFIEAIDTYLEAESSPEPDRSVDGASP